MKIAILTQPLHSNYGGILQAYALQSVLRREGHNVIIIDRCKGYPSLKELVYRLGSFIKCIIRLYIKHDKNFILCNPFIKGSYTVRRMPRYDNIKLREFINAEINKSKPIYSTRSLRKYIDKQQFNCIIVGSDQVWREDYSPCIENYFLDFLSLKSKYKAIKKVSYAASFGVSDYPISSCKLSRCISLLSNFDKVSVREASGREYLLKVFNCDSKLVLDPTLLLQQEDYYKLIREKKSVRSGVVSYILDKNVEKQYIISDVVDRLDLFSSELTISPTDKNGNPIPLVSISEWLATFANADFIVTDSFHGCVFSILFRKNFIAIGNKLRGIDRFSTLLDSFGLLNQLVLSQEEYINRIDDLFQPIDYDKVYVILRSLKKQSLEFLLNI